MTCEVTLPHFPCKCPVFLVQMHQIGGFHFPLPVFAEKCCHLLDEYVFQVSCEHSAALVLGAYMLHTLVIGFEEHVEPLERNIDVGVSAFLPVLLFRRLSTGEGVTVHLVPNGFVVIAEVDCSLWL